MDTLHEKTLEQTETREDGTLDINGALRKLLENLLNAIMDEQANELGVPRNGYRERSLDTCVGTIALRIPKLREGSYFPADVVQRWSRTDTALASMICEMWTAGISTRKVETIANQMGIRSLSRSRVSRLCEGLDAEVAEMCERDLSFIEWPYLWLDATYVPCREAGAARSTAIVTAVACNLSGKRSVVGMGCVDAESYASWRDFLLSLRKRGMSGVQLVISDAHTGLQRAIKEVLLGASWQRCIAHLERNVMERCRKKGNGAAAVAALKKAFAEDDPRLVRAGYRAAVDLLAEVDERGAELLEEATADALSYLDFPAEHKTWIRTNNVQERMNGEIKRRTRVVQVFPSTKSLIRLVGAVCCDQNDAWLSRSMIDPRTMKPDYEPDPLPLAGPEDEARVIRLVQDAFDKKRKAA